MKFAIPPDKRSANTISGLELRNYIVLLIYPGLRDDTSIIDSYISDLKNSTSTTKSYISFFAINDLKSINVIVYELHCSGYIKLEKY